MTELISKLARGHEILIMNHELRLSWYRAAKRIIFCGAEMTGVLRSLPLR